MTDEVFRSARADEQSKVYDTLVSAFTDDPVERWMWPDHADYVVHFRAFVDAMGGRAFDTGTVWCLEPGSTVALWLPPGTEPDGEAIEHVLTTTVPESQHDDLYAVIEDMEVAHPSYPHWYLPWFGVDCGAQGQGLGSVLMRECLRVVDADGLPAYLESPNPRNVAFYERHGFAVVGVSQHGGCPPVTFMKRDPR